MMNCRGTVYKLTVTIKEKMAGLDSETTHTYVGSTKKPLSRRFAEHKAHAIKSPSPLYKKIREASSVTIAEIEHGAYKNVQELRLREEFWRKKLMPDLNVRRCHITEQEREEESRKRSAKYYQENKERILPGARIRALRHYYEKKAALVAA